MKSAGIWRPSVSSISPAEIQFQRQGYADAITSEAVLKVIAQSAYGKIAVTYVEWAAHTGQVTPWMVIDGPDSAAAFAQALLVPPLRGLLAVRMPLGPDARRLPVRPRLADRTVVILALYCYRCDGLPRAQVMF